MLLRVSGKPSSLLVILYESHPRSYLPLAQRIRMQYINNLRHHDTSTNQYEAPMHLTYLQHKRINNSTDTNATKATVSNSHHAIN